MSDYKRKDTGYNARLERCLDKRTDCYARTCNGYCIALQDTYFKNGICTFYGERSAVKNERIKKDGKFIYEYFVEEGVYIDEEQEGSEKDDWCDW